jgi:hypothetical protein
VFDSHFRKAAMKSTLTINDLSASKELDHEAMSAIQGGAEPLHLHHESLHASHAPTDLPWQTLSPPGGFPSNGSVVGGAVPIS